MAVQFTCPHCGTETAVSEEYAGQTGPCAACGKTVTVPPLRGTPGYAGRKKSTSTPILVAAVFVAVIVGLLICGGLMAVFFVRVDVAPPIPPPPVTVLEPAVN